MPLLEVRPEAELDALEAASWYEGDREGLGAEFLIELRTTFTRIEEGPLRFPLVFRNLRRAIDTLLPHNPAGKILENLLRGLGSASFDPEDLA